MRYEHIPSLKAWSIDAYTVVNRTDPEIVTLLNDYRKYDQAFTPMAKRNMMRALSKDLQQWKPAWGRKPVAWEALNEVVERTIKYSEGAIGKKYTKVLCIGHRINVGKFDKTNKVAYSGQLDDEADMEQRAANMLTAINSAWNSISPIHRDDPQILKIFMGPEFYFRGRYGAYPHDVVSQIIPRMRQGGTGQPTFSDWLFVFGTAIAAAIDEVTWCFTCGSNKNVKFLPDPTRPRKTKAICTVSPTHDVRPGVRGATIDNVALVQRGTEDYLVFKEFVSPIDFRSYQVNMPVQPGGKREWVDVLPPEGARERVPSMQNPAVPSSYGSHITSKHLDERMGGCVFSFDGIQFGLEICLDHGEGGGRLDGAEDIDVLLIPSAGMKIEYWRTVDNGISFNVDGLRAMQGQAASQVLRKSGAPAYEPATQYRAGAKAGALEVFGPFDLP